MTLQIQFAFVDPNIAIGIMQYGSMAVALSGGGRLITCMMRSLGKYALQ